MEPSSPRSPLERSAGHYAKSPRAKPLQTHTGLPSPPQSSSKDEIMIHSLTALPPLVPSSNANAVSPRATRDATLRPLAFPLQLDREYTVAELDNWPLFTTSSTGLHWNNSPRHGNAATVGSPAKSPLSPRARKSQTRHKLLDDAKSTPLLLQQLYAFAKAELHAIGPSDDRDDMTLAASPTLPNLQRLQVFRELFGRVIASFSVYAPLLAQIQDEYETAIRHLVTKCQLVPQLHGELQSLETQCLQQLSQHQLETKRHHKTLQRMLRQTQATLAACAAENAHLKDDNARASEQLRTLERRYEEMHESNHSLVNGMRRHDDTLRHIHERSREEGMALQQMTLKYHRACDEIAELKKTVAALEEKVGGVHVAADKATIALLTKDLQDMHTKLTAYQQSPPEIDSGSRSSDRILHRLYISLLERNGAATTELQLLERIQAQSLGIDASSPSISKTLSPLARTVSCLTLKMPPERRLSDALSEVPAIDLAFGIDRVASALSVQIALFHQEMHPGAATCSSTATFLTESEEQVSFSSCGAQILTPLVSSTDLIKARGTDADVPEYLQYEGVVRNLYYDRKRVELLIAKVWAYKEDLEGKAKRQHSVSSPGGGSSVRLAQAFALYLQRCFPSNRHDQVECAYNVVAALDRFTSGSSECRLFQLILNKELPDEARGDLTKELACLHDTLSTMQRELKAASQRAGLPLADVVQALRRLFPWKSDDQLSRLHHTLLIDLRGYALVDFAMLLQQCDDHTNRRGGLGKPRARSQFVECLRAQYMDDLLGFRRHVQHYVSQEYTSIDKPVGGTGFAADDEGSKVSTGMVAVRVLRDCLQQCDPAKPVQEINRLLTIATGLSMDQILTHDVIMVSASQFVAMLPTLLVKPSGKFGGKGSNGAAADTLVSIGTAASGSTDVT